MDSLVLIAMLLTPAAPDGRPHGDTGKGGQPVCRTLAETGSRLARRRVCMTRDAWAEYRRLQRDELQRMQVNAGIPGVD